MDIGTSSNSQISTLLESILSSRTFPSASVIAPDHSPSPYSPSQQSDTLCGSCPSSGSAPQTNNLWPSLPPSGTGFPTWSGQPTQPAPCWPGTQPAPVSVPTSISVPAPTQALTPAPAAPGQPCQPCWPVPQYQPPQPPAPIQAQAPTQTPTPIPVPTPALNPAPDTSIHPNIPRWPAQPGWPYNPGQSGWPGQNPSLVPPNWLPPTSGPLNVPYNLNLARGVYDKMMLTILGYVKPNPKMFTVNFLRGSDIAFHLNPRFNEGGKQVVVRNHKLGERWGAEERALKGPFPFAPGSPFEMKILCTHEAFRVAVNNIPLFEFQHRIRELNQIDRINILHDVVLTYVNVETLP